MTNPQLLSLLSNPHHGGILTGGNMLGTRGHVGYFGHVGRGGEDRTGQDTTDI